MSKSELMTINGNVVTAKDIFSSVDNHLIQLNDTGNLNEILGVIESLDKVDTVIGKAKAKLLWGTSQWYAINHPDEDFGDHVESTTSTKRVTVLRYVNVWEHIEQENIPKNIQARPMRELVPIANMLSQGFEPSKAEWNKIDLCSNSHELGEVLAKIKNKKQRKTARKIVMERDGHINLWKNDKKMYIGFLDVEEARENKDLADAIEYIIADRITRI